MIVPANGVPLTQNCPLVASSGPSNAPPIEPSNTKLIARGI